MQFEFPFDRLDYLSSPFQIWGHVSNIWLDFWYRFGLGFEVNGRRPDRLVVSDRV